MGYQPPNNGRGPVRATNDFGLGNNNSGMGGGYNGLNNVNKQMGINVGGGYD